MVFPCLCLAFSFCGDGEEAHGCRRRCRGCGRGGSGRCRAGSKQRMGCIPMRDLALFHMLARVVKCLNIVLGEIRMQPHRLRHWMLLYRGLGLPLRHQGHGERTGPLLLMLWRGHYGCQESRMHWQQSEHHISASGQIRVRSWKMK